MKLFFLKLIFSFTSWRLRFPLNDYLSEWQKIDHRKDRSWSAKDFHFYVYLRENRRLEKKLEDNLNIKKIK